MKKILILSLFALAFLSSTFTFASDDVLTTPKSGSGTLTSTQIACIKTAVEKRENSIITATTTFQTAILSALTTRKTDLLAARSLTTKEEIKTAVKKARDTFKSSKKTAKESLKKSEKAAWTIFKKDRKNCKLPSSILELEKENELTKTIE